MRDVFDVTPPMLKESAYALGSTTWEVVFKVVLPYTKAGVIGGIMLGLGRALGETMAVTFVIGNFNQLDSLSPVPGRQQHHLGAGQRIRRGRQRPAPGGADLPGPGAVLHHLRGALAVQAAAGTAEEAAKEPRHERGHRRAPGPGGRPQPRARAHVRPAQARQQGGALAVAGRHGVRHVLAGVDSLGNRAAGRRRAWRGRP